MNSKLKITLSLSLLILLCSSCMFKMADLRTETAKTSQDEAKARQLLQEMAMAHGTEGWDSIETYEVSFEDEFYGFVGKQGNPFKEDKTSIRLRYIPNSYDGQLTILSGEKKDLT